MKTTNEMITEMNRLYLDNRHDLDGKCFIVGKEAHLALLRRNIYRHLNLNILWSGELDPWAFTLDYEPVEIAP